MLYAGLDLSRQRLDVHLLDEDGRTVEVTAVRPDADALRTLVARIDRYGQPVSAAIESMNGARFVHDTLERAGWEVEIADALKVKGLAPLAAKTDRIDAWVLAELGRRELVPAIWLPDPANRAERERARFRLHLVRHRAALKNRIHATLTMRVLAREIRLRHKRKANPTMMMIDGQTVKGGRAGPTFHEAGGRGGYTRGAKRTILIEILGLPLAVSVESAKPHDVQSPRRILKAQLDPQHLALPGLQAIVADRGYTGLAALASGHGVNLDIKVPPAPPMLPPAKLRATADSVPCESHNAGRHSSRVFGATLQVRRRPRIREMA